MSGKSPAPVTSASLWRRIWRFARAFDAAFPADETALLASRVVKIERELAERIGPQSGQSN